MKERKDVKLDYRQRQLRKVREEANISRQQLAFKLGVHMRTIVRWEREERALNEENFTRSIDAIEALRKGDDSPTAAAAPRTVTDASAPVYDLTQVPLLELSRELTRRLESL